MSKINQNQYKEHFMTIVQQDREEIKKVLSNFQKKKSVEEMFYHLCFCLCSPQTTHKNNLTTVQTLRDLNFFEEYIPEEQLQKILVPVRFYKNKARYLLSAKEGFLYTCYMTVAFPFADTLKRDVLVANIKGLGMKTASHFLRNCGATNLAIIDAHILKFLKEKEVTPKTYILLEGKFRKIAEKNDLSVAELDAWVWKTYSNTSWENFVY
jgi:N-glycosylase/DNA lyase